MGGEGPLLGRGPELEQVRRLAAHARNGRGGALLVLGEPGIGKTSLLRAAAAAVPDFRVLRADGHEAESTIPYAALQRLMIPLREHVPALPGRHQQALRIATGVFTGPPPDRFLVGLGTLGLLAAAGEVAPVACFVDDTHFLDPESLDALAFVARRLEAESAVLVFASRDVPEVEQRMTGVPTLRLDGLPQEAAVRLLTSRLPEPIDPAVAAQIAASTGGNPLALTDLAVELSAARLAEAGFAEEPVPVGHHLQAHYLGRVRQLTDHQQRWLLVAAADSTGNLDMIRAAAETLGLPPSAGEEAEAAGLVELDVSVRFRHPLVRAAVYGAARGADRRRVHAALAAAAAGLDASALEAWHAAKATLGTDADVADRLESVADLAGRRGGSISRASVLVQAAALTPDRARAGRRLVAAAEAALAAGVAQFAKGLLDEVDEDDLDPLTRGRMVAVRASVAIFTADPALRSATSDMLVAAEAMASYDVGAAQDTLIQAMYFLLPAERLATGITLPELGQRLQAGAELQDGVPATILRGLAAHVMLPYPEAVPLMRKAVDEISGLEAEQLLIYGPSASSSPRPCGTRRRCTSACNGPSTAPATWARSGCST
ncbi:AAA family ATPase [Nocardioides sp. GXQ0305]|uniref:AAA family ATPase n=1 Tax=Nocardioides sp. GXQ0305 TaxID=3423912 RepID=UPI003D7E3297